MRSKREILLLSGIVIAAVILVHERLAPSMQKNKIEARQRIEKTKRFIADQEQRIQSSRLQWHETLMLNVLLKEIPPNPFARQWIGIVSDQKRINSLSTIEPVLSYNGYIRAGERYIALVNEEDYEIGNKIEHVPLVIRSISPEKIDVENPNTVSQSRLSIKILPLESENED